MDEPDNANEAELDSEEKRPDRFFLYLWTAWGGVTGGLTYLFDRNPLAALAWIAAGLMIGVLSVRVLTVLVESYSRWCIERFRDDRRIDRQFELIESGRELSAEYQALPKRDCSEGLMSITPFLGLHSGVLLGAPFGALAKIDPEFAQSASQGAVMTAILFPIPAMFIAGLVFGVLDAKQSSTSRTQRMRRFFALALSPLLLIPASAHFVLYCAKTSWRWAIRFNASIGS